tara:strand:- start:1228 stop:1461 length:234 start_codon:yes stop_codon:yes gene_type:complete
MRNMLEAILAFSNHFGEQVHLDLEDPGMIRDLLGKDEDDEWFIEIMKDLESLRQHLGGLSTMTRSLRDRVKYGEDRK